MTTARLRRSYTLFSWCYDWVVDRPLRRARRASMARLARNGSLHILIDGIGTGLDLRWVPLNHRYVGIDLTPAMLRGAQRRRSALELALIQGDSERLPFCDASFDCVILHLIVAVVADPVRALAEAHRVLRPGGSVLVLDKFLRRGERAPLRRMLSPIAAQVATRFDVVFEEVLERVPGLVVVSDEPALLRGWFRRIELKKSREE